MAPRSTTTKAKTATAQKLPPVTNASRKIATKKTMTKAAAKKPTTRVIAGSKKAAAKTGARAKGK